MQPLVALALALRARGHDVSFLVPDNFVAWVASYGFACDANGIDVEALLRSGVDLSSARSQLHHFRTALLPKQFDWFARVTDPPDVVVGAGVQLAARSAAEKWDIAYATVVFCPCAVPSSIAPPPTVRVQTLPRWINRLLWDLGLPIAGVALRSVFNEGRARLGLAPVSNPLSLLADEPVVLAADTDLAPLGNDAPAHVVCTDAWQLEDWIDLDPQLDAFLQLEPRPIYVGFGSMVARHARDLAAASIAAARALGRPLLLAGGWAALDREIMNGDDVFAAEMVPHRAVLPRVAAAVHHGGAGTTTAAARAGVPQVILPHLLDQYYWAHRVAQLGLGPRGLSVELVNADVLTDRVAAALEDPRIGSRAAAFAPLVASRNGVDAAVHHLESFADRGR